MRLREAWASARFGANGCRSISPDVGPFAAARHDWPPKSVRLLVRGNCQTPTPRSLTMTSKAQFRVPDEPFADARSTFDAIVGWLRGDDVPQTEADIERAISKRA